MKWEYLREEEFKPAIEKSGGLCVMCLGCIEKHGQHLPVGTDSLKGDKIVELASERAGVVMFPTTMWLGDVVSSHAVGAPEAILEGLRANFMGECTEVGMYLAMARVAHREGYPEIGLYWEKAAYEEAEHAAKFAELLGEVVTDSTKKNLEMRVEAENGATAGKFELAKMAKELNLDAIHDTVHEMAKDEARHGKAFQGLLKRYFK